MATRYSTLSKKEEILVLEGCPVIITAYALLKDSKTDNIILQLKMKNLSDKNVSAVKVHIDAFEINGSEIDEDIFLSYLDLNIPQGEYFGDRKAQILPNDLIRIVKPCITEIVYSDGSIWSHEKTSWNILKEPGLFPFTDAELIAQFILESKGKTNNLPIETNGFFICSCGNINIAGTKCFCCGKQYEELADLINDPDGLESRKNERKKEEEYKDCVARYNECNTEEDFLLLKVRFEKLGDYMDSSTWIDSCQEMAETVAEEKRKKEKAEKERKEKALIAEQKRRKKKRILTALFCSIGAVLLSGFLYLYFTQIKPANNYRQANALLQEGNFAEAESLFKELGVYKDASKLEIYAKAKKEISESRWDEAIIDLQKLADYLDSKDLIRKATYGKADTLYRKKSYDAASSIFASLGEYQDASDRVLDCSYQIAMEHKKKGEYSEALTILKKMSSYKDSESQIKAITFSIAERYAKSNVLSDLYQAYNLFTSLGTYSSSKTKADNAFTALVEAQLDRGFSSTAFPSKLTKDQQIILYNTVISQVNSYCNEFDELKDWTYTEAYSGVSSPASRIHCLLNYVTDSDEINKNADAYKSLFARLSSGSYEYYTNQKEVLLQNLNLPFVKEIMGYSDLLLEYLEGYWVTADWAYYFKMEEDHYSSFNLPWEKPDGTKYYQIDEYVFQWIDGNNKVLYTLFKFEIIDETTIEVYCYKDRKTYTLYKQY